MSKVLGQLFIRKPSLAMKPVQWCHCQIQSHPIAQLIALSCSAQMSTSDVACLFSLAFGGARSLRVAIGSLYEIGQ